MTKRILIAEDDAFLAKILSNKIKNDGFEVESVANGADALTQASESDYNLILTDLIMPELDGFELLKRLKENGNNTPVLVFSNLAQAEDEAEVMKLGAKYFFNKSTPIDDLIVIVKKYAS